MGRLSVGVGRLSAGCEEAVCWVWGGCREATWACRKAVWRVWGGCLDDFMRLYGE